VKFASSSEQGRIDQNPHFEEENYSSALILRSKERCFYALSR